MICPECGKKLPDDAGFCIRCGANQNNPNAEVYKKTRTAERSSPNELEEPTAISNIIPDEPVSEPEESIPEGDSENNEAVLKTDDFVPEFQKQDETESEDEDSDDDDDEDDDDNSGKSVRLAVLSVVCIVLLAACIVVYFFTKNNAGENNPESPAVTDPAETSAVITEVITETSETVTETSETVTETPAPEISVVSDAAGNTYDIVLSDDIQAVVKVDEGTLRLRAYPSTDATVLGIMVDGDNVTIKGACGDWYYIISDDREGYAFNEYIHIEETAQTSESEAVSESETVYSETSE